MPPKFVRLLERQKGKAPNRRALPSMWPWPKWRRYLTLLIGIMVYNIANIYIASKKHHLKNMHVFIIKVYITHILQVQILTFVTTLEHHIC